MQIKDCINEITKHQHKLEKISKGQQIRNNVYLSLLNGDEFKILFYLLDWENTEHNFTATIWS